MKTLEQIIAYKAQSIDERDVSRLVRFLSESQLNSMGIKLKDEFKGSHVPEEFSREAVLKYMAGDLEFAFEKAIGQRGISASCMNDVMKMWMWVLDDDLAECEEYAQYGLPLLKKIAVKYGLPNEIGEDYGDEDKYAA